MRWLPGRLKAQLRRLLVERPVRPADVEPGLRRDVEVVDVGSGVEFVVYWKVLEVGIGPAIVVQTADVELMKFDCFGGTAGHFHIAPAYDTRLAFVEDTVDEQITRTGLELRRNLGRYLAADPRRSINRISLDPRRLDTAADRAEELLRRNAATAGAQSSG